MLAFQGWVPCNFVYQESLSMSPFSEVSADCSSWASDAVSCRLSLHGKLQWKDFWVCVYKNFLKMILKRFTVFNYSIQGCLSARIVFPRHPQPKKHIWSCVSVLLGHFQLYHTHNFKWQMLGYPAVTSSQLISSRWAPIPSRWTNCILEYDVQPWHFLWNRVWGDYPVLTRS